MGTRVAVAGASGYAGGELLRLLARHPDLDVVTVTGHGSAGRPLGEVQPHLLSFADLVLAETTPEALAGHDVVFLALPHGRSGALADALGDDVLVVDAGADHRLTSADDWHAFYPGEHHGAWPYGVPELLTKDGKQRDALAGVRRIAAPGCNASTVALALAPAVAAGLVEADDLVAVLAVGPSGAGRSTRADLSASELLGSANAYQVGGVHRHVPEILQGLSAVTGVRLLPAGRFPAIEHTIGANTLLLGLAVDAAANRLVVVAAMDNLVKGTAGAAIQSANIALGLPEHAGLPLDGTAP